MRDDHYPYPGPAHLGGREARSRLCPLRLQPCFQVLAPVGRDAAYHPRLGKQLFPSESGRGLPPVTLAFERRE
jgi:hypothetical protein